MRLARSGNRKRLTRNWFASVKSPAVETRPIPIGTPSYSARKRSFSRSDMRRVFQVSTAYRIERVTSSEVNRCLLR
jgi:hypothetical protein